MRQTIFDLTDDYLHLLELAEDPETPEDVLADTLEGLEGAIEEKADSYGAVLAQMKADEAGLKMTIERLQNKLVANQHGQKRLKDNLYYCMTTTGKTRFKTNNFNFSVRATTPSVELDVDVYRLPAEYLAKQEPKPDKKKIKEAILNGIDLTGIAHLKQGEALYIT